VEGDDEEVGLVGGRTHRGRDAREAARLGEGAGAWWAARIGAERFIVADDLDVGGARFQRRGPRLAGPDTVDAHDADPVPSDVLDERAHRLVDRLAGADRAQPARVAVGDGLADALGAVV